MPRAWPVTGIREVFEADAEVFFVFNGTAANSIALASLCQSYQAVICSDTAHVETDECGAPEFFSNGSKLLSAPHRHGKLTSAGVLEVIHPPHRCALPAAQGRHVDPVYRNGIGLPEG